MGVYIKGMKMPETKYECDFWNIDHICTANPKATVCDPANGIYPPEDCPLVEIPEPHGRLIDANDVTERIRQRLGIRNIDYLLEAEKPIAMSIDSSPTVIEAEGE